MSLRLTQCCAIVALYVDICVCLHQHLDNLLVTDPSGMNQCCVAMVALCVDICVCLHQHFDNLLVTARCCINQCCVAIHVLYVDICVCLHQHLDNLCVTSLHRKYQRRCSPLVSCINVLLRVWLRFHDFKL